MHRYIRSAVIMAAGSLILVVAACGSTPNAGSRTTSGSFSAAPFTSSPFDSGSPSGSSGGSNSFPGPSGSSEPDEQLPVPASGPGPSQSAAPQSPGATPPPARACSSNPMAHVWDPSRLVILASCVTVSGTIAAMNVSHDGDFHVLVRLDAGQTCGGQACLNSVNSSNSYGDLVVEVICAVPAGVPACSGYQNTINPPPVGSHVVVTGPWVSDKSTGWNEIHPVESM